MCLLLLYLVFLCVFCLLLLYLVFLLLCFLFLCLLYFCFLLLRHDSCFLDIIFFCLKITDVVNFKVTYSLDQALLVTLPFLLLRLLLLCRRRLQFLLHCLFMCCHHHLNEHWLIHHRSHTVPRNTLKLGQLSHSFFLHFFPHPCLLQHYHQRGFTNLCKPHK